MVHSEAPTIKKNIILPLNAFVIANCGKRNSAGNLLAAIGACLLLWLCSGRALAADPLPQVKVTAPYIELHTGPGVGYPVFHVADRDALLEVIKRKTDWFKVRTDKGLEGWVSREQFETTVLPSGAPSQLHEAALGDFSSRRWEIGLTGGSFNSTPLLSLYGGYAFTATLSAELAAGQVLGDYFSSQLYNIKLLSQPFPRWRVSPFFALGAGYLASKTHATLVAPKDTEDFTAQAGLGVRVYLSRRFILRAEYNDYVVFSSDDNNEEFKEWKAGFAFFF